MRSEIRSARYGQQGDSQVADLRQLMRVAPMSKEDHAAVQRRRVEVRRRMEDVHAKRREGGEHG